MSAFDPTKPVQTRAGGYARVIDTKFKSPGGNILAVIAEADREFVRAYYADGRYSLSRELGVDLVNVPEKIERWHNVYSDGSTNDFKTRAAADDYESYSLAKRIACVFLSVEKGQGL